MHDTLDERLSPIRPLLYQGKIKVVGSGFEAIAGTPPRGWGANSTSWYFQDQALPQYLNRYHLTNPTKER